MCVLPLLSTILMSAIFLCLQDIHIIDSIECVLPINSSPDDKILDWSKLKAFADDTINLIQNHEFYGEWVENVAEKGENAGYQYFLLFQHCFLLQGR